MSERLDLGKIGEVAPLGIAGCFFSASCAAASSALVMCSSHVALYPSCVIACRSNRTRCMYALAARLMRIPSTTGASSAPRSDAYETRSRPSASVRAWKWGKWQSVCCGDFWRCLCISSTLCKKSSRSLPNERTMDR